MDNLESFGQSLMSSLLLLSLSLWTGQVMFWVLEPIGAAWVCPDPAAHPLRTLVRLPTLSISSSVVAPVPFRLKLMAALVQRAVILTMCASG